MCHHLTLCFCIFAEEVTRLHYKVALVIDVLGGAHFLYIPEGSSDYVEFEKGGVGVDGSSLPGISRVEDSDIIAIPDGESKYNMNNELGDLYDIYFTYLLDKVTRKPLDTDVRRITSLVDKKLKELGYILYIRPELEFYCIPEEYYNETVLAPSKCYITDYMLSIDKDSYLLLRSEVVSALNRLGIGVRYHHHENGPGQQEIEISPVKTAKKAADVITLSRIIISKISREYGFIATFMPKPFSNEAGSGLHMHFYLKNDAGENVFYKDGELTDTGKYFIAGVLKHAREIALITNPTVNSYKRLGAHEAPSSISWGFANRTAMIRIPASKKSIEVRNPDPMINPYLAIAAIVFAGLDGIEREEDPPQSITGSTYSREDIMKLPRSFEEALNELINSSWVRATLGRVVENYIELKRREYEEFSKSVTDWEIKKYLTMF